MITIKVYSREDILRLKDTIPETTKIVSIVSSQNDLIDWTPYNNFSIVFWDVTDEVCPGAFSESDAKKLSSWIKEQIYDPKISNFELWIHCDAGISRSYAVAEVIYEFAVQALGREDFIFLLYRHPSKHSNSLVRRRLMKELETLILDYTED